MLRYGLILAAAVFIADQIAKFYVLNTLGFSPPGCLSGNYGCGFVEISGIFDLRMVWNRGFSFGLGRAENDLGRWALVVMQLGISGVFFWWLRTAPRRLTATALGLVIGGALGNVIDRIRFGAVADFFDFSGIGFFPWVFNVADAGITVGAILLAVDMIFLSETEPGKGSSWSQFKARLSGAGSKSDPPDPGGGG
ncbi:signal peptidase II [Terricaulis sp.]|uniref:signal peptidase II n=1 Tax=Terricaulis sp. TaxID=2768686 RepID=UPI0037832861